MSLCVNINCKKQASFNIIGEKPKYCKAHKDEDMINVKNNKQTCEYLNCETRPCYNFKGLKRKYCAKHKLKGMIDVINKSCNYNNCIKRPVYNYDNEIIPIFCNEHKLEDMINIKDKKCVIDKCKTIPVYNYYGEKAKYCIKHKLDGMINVKDKTCVNPECKKIPAYNYFNEKTRLFCEEHKLNGMVNIISKTCIFPECEIYPIFNYLGLPALYCNIHKSEEMIDVVHKTCKANYCMSRPSGNKQCKEYCLRCFINLFPDESISRNFKIKERHVTDYLKINFDGININYDKKVGGCSNKRPDVYIDLLTHIIIVEIDENQHKYYDSTCEMVRLNLLFEDFAFRPIVFIRFNPDGYIDKHNVKIRSCFSMDYKTGILKISSKKKTEWKLRLEDLFGRIKYHINNIPDKNIFEYLYFDT